MTLQIKGGNVSAWNTTDVSSVLATISTLKLNTITVPIRITMVSADDDEPMIDAESLAFAQSVYAAIKDQVNIIIEPYPWVANGTVPETSISPSNVYQWFVNWNNCLNDLATYFPDTWGMYIASNFVELERHTSQWLSLINTFRLYYTGRILYRTNWWITATWDTGSGSTTAKYLAKLSNSLFGAVDIIAVSAYFELTDIDSPTYEQVLAALQSTTVFGRGQNVVAEVKALASNWNKPYFFGELGVPARNDGALNPWNPDVSATLNTTIQEAVLRAYITSFSDDPLFQGGSLFVVANPTATSYTLEASAAAYWTGLSAARKSTVRDIEPIYSVTTERIYSRLPEFYRTLDQQNGYALKTYISAIGDQLYEVEQLVARIEYVPEEDRPDYYAALDQYNTYARPDGLEDPDYGFAPIAETSDLLDGRTADDDWLLYIGQLIGADLRHLYDMSARRNAVVNNYLGLRAGSRQALIAATQAVLTGAKFVRVYPHRDGDAGSVSSVGTEWDVLIITKPEETPSGTTVIDNILAEGAKPAGVVLHHIVYVAVWSDIETMFPTWGDLETLGNTWENIESGNADLLAP